MPSDIVRVKFLQPVAFGVDEGCTVGSLHPLVHPADKSVDSVLSSVYREDAQGVEGVGDDKCAMLVCDLCDLSDFLSAAIGPGDVVYGDD